MEPSVFSEAEFVAMEITLIIFIVLGILGNVGVILAIAFIRKWRTPGNLLLANLAAADLLVNVWTFPITLVNLLKRRQAVSDTFCQISAFVDNTIILVSVWTLATSAVVRYLIITRPKATIWKIINHKGIVRMIIGIWAGSLMTSAMPVLGWDSYAYSPVTFSCGIQGLRGHHRYYFLFFCLVAFPGPFIMMSYSYLRIFQKICTVQKCSKRHLLRQVRASTILLVMIIMFSVSTLPTFIISLIFWAQMRLSMHIKVPIVLHWILQSNATINPIIYSVLNSKYRKAWRQYVTEKRYRTFVRKSVTNFESKYRTNGSWKDGGSVKNVASKRRVLKRQAAKSLSPQDLPKLSPTNPTLFASAV